MSVKKNMESPVSPLFRTLSILGLILVFVITISLAFHFADIKLSASLLPIVTRTEWGALPPRNPPELLPNRPAPFVIIIHSATDFCYDQRECSRHMRFIQRHHMESRGWDDISYNFLVGGDGAIYEGRGWDVQGAHTINYDHKSIGIAFIGTFTNKEPTEGQIKAARKLIEYGVETGKIAGDYALLGHRQCIETESPGEKLYGIIKSWPHWTAEPKEMDSDLSSILGVPYVQRQEWLAQSPSQPLGKLQELPPPYVIISHTAGNFCYERSKCIRIVRYIQRFHIESQGWGDIGYNFLVGGDGAIYVGRGWDVEGAHTINYNKKSIGISFIGTFTNRVPTDKQLNAAKKIIQYGLNHGKIAEDYKLLGHRQCIATESPGEKLYEIIKTWPNWSSVP